MLQAPVGNEPLDHLGVCDLGPTLKIWIHPIKKSPDDGQDFSISKKAVVLSFAGGTGI